MDFFALEVFFDDDTAFFVVFGFGAGVFFAGFLVEVGAFLELSDFLVLFGFWVGLVTFLVLPGFFVLWGL